MAKIGNQQYIIAIGASAGGLEAISAFFDHTPLDAISYILIQHLSSDFKSHMAQILSRHSKLEIIEATDNVSIEPNKVYLIPNTDFMQIKGGKLLLSDKKNMPRPHMTIDHFFISLAEEYRDKAIGIILSGTGNDGSKGVKAIKDLGGTIIIQDPDTASYNGMPLAAIATDCADFILAPEAMPRVIEDHVNSDINENDLTDIVSLIKGNLPLDFTDYKHPTISRRVKRRMQYQNLNRVADYYKFLKNNSKEIEMLANDFLIGVTSFFRDQEAFEVIEKTVLPDIIKHKSTGDILKIWVAGCATGEEAYSIAILIKEYLNKMQISLEVKIFATDINKAALDIASKGIYAENIQKTVSKERLQLFFTHEGTSFKVSPEIRKMLIFAQHDLVKNPPYCNIDLISCRNLLIYMNASLQRKVFSMMHFGLKKDGYLFLGPSENAAVLTDDFNEISNKWNILKSKKNGRLVRFDTTLSPVIEGIKTTTTTMNKQAMVPMSKLAMADEINMAILEESGFRGICTDENLTVIRSFGDPSAYLKNEIFNFNLNDLLPDNIAIAFKAAAHKALKLNQRIILKGLEFENAATRVRLVDIVIKPFLMAKSSDKLLLILFIENKDKVKENNIIKAGDISQLTKEHLISLENELADAKRDLEIAYERIASSNENMQSFNEELLSANEELQSANEELQSLNEELQTINKEQQFTNKELTEANDDLNNYFRSNVNGQLFVDHNLMLKKYSPAAVEHINVRENDIGRPISNITTNIRLDTFIDDIKQVMLDSETIIREATSTKGNTYQVMTMPYIKKNSNIANGAIISFYDITELKSLLQKIDTSNKSLLTINQKITTVNEELQERNEQLINSRKYTEEIFSTIHDPLVILNKELRVLRASEGFFSVFKVNEKETEGTFLYDLGNQQWNIPILRNQLENVLPEQGSFKAFEVDHVFNLIGRRIMRLTARQFDTYTGEKLILLAIHDITDKRKVEEGLAEAERLLAESKERLHFAIESAGIGAWDFNPITQELIWDNRCKELYGLKPGDPVDYKVFLDQIHVDDRNLTVDAINKTLLGMNNGEFNIEYRSVGLNDHKLRWLKSKGKAYFNNENKATRFIGTVLDISIEKTLEENTKELLLKKDEFISIASHELKTPITSLKASLQLLSRMKNNPSPTMLPVLLNQSTRSMEKICSLIDDLLNVTRMNEGQLHLNKVTFTIADLLSSCCSHVRIKGKYQLILQGDLTLQVHADEHRIDQVIVNFVNNAIKYAADSKNIYFVIEKENDKAKISVKDTGHGVPADKLPYLFDRYYRADYQGGEQYSGLGLGLYICAEIIKRHGGEIGVESEVGKGSTFWFTLPL